MVGLAPVVARGPMGPLHVKRGVCDDAGGRWGRVVGAVVCVGDHCVCVESMDVCKQRTIESSRVCHVQPYRCYPDTGLLGLAVLWVIVLGIRTFLSSSRLVGTPRIRGCLCMGGDWGDAEYSEHEGGP